MCESAESNPNAIFLKVNYEELKSMCNVLHILPFFRFYKGAQGKVCSFSCTNATVSFCKTIFDLSREVYFLIVELVYMQIKKFKDAVSRYGNEGCGFSPATALEESELLALASIGQK